MKKFLNYIIFTTLFFLSAQINAFDGYVEISPAQPTQSGKDVIADKELLLANLTAINYSFGLSVRTLL